MISLAPSRRPWTGVVLALAVALSFAANSTFAGLAYTGGADAMSVFALRSTAAFTILFAVLTVSGRSWRLPPRRRNIALALGVVMAWASWALLASMERMAVALCVITLYTYPLLVAASGWISKREPFRVRHAVALLAAFGGLVLALDLSGGRPNAVGIALAASGAVGVAGLLVISERARPPEDSQAFTLHMLATCMILAVTTNIALGQFALPQSTGAWLGFVAVPVCYSFSIIGMFVAVSMIGSLRTSLVMNLEPVSSVLLGYVLLSQSLNATQLFGIALVITAVVSIEGVGAGAIRSRIEPRQ